LCFCLCNLIYEIMKKEIEILYYIKTLNNFLHKKEKKIKIYVLVIFILVVFITKLLMNKIKWRFTFSVTATLRIFHRNSQMAIKNEAPQPHNRTKNTPPTLANPNSFVLTLFSASSFLHKPPPISCHHFFLSDCKVPFSPNVRIAPLIGVR